MKNIRENFIEGKLYYTRATSYLNIFNFLMIVIIFLSTTLWDYQPIQNIFPSKRLFLLAGFVIVLITIGILGYLDTRFKLWRTEAERGLIPERNPQLVPIAFQCAKMINDLKSQGKDTTIIEVHLNTIFERCNMMQEFELFKDNTK
jgi:hypothetical protein